MRRPRARLFSHNQSSILAGAARTDARDNTKSGGYFLSAVERESLDFDSPIRNACDHPTAPRLGGDAAASAARPGNVDPILVFAGGYTQRSLNRAHPGGQSAVRMNLRPYPQLITETGDGLSIATLPPPWSNAAGASYLVWMCKPWGEKALINALKGTRTPFGAITRRIWLARPTAAPGSAGSDLCKPLRGCRHAWVPVATRYPGFNIIKGGGCSLYD